MSCEHLYTYDNPHSERDIERICKILEDDGIIAYPTDTNWAIGCDAKSSHALDRLYYLKPAHPKDRPFSLICSSIAMASEYGTIDHTAYRLLKKIWPGPFTVLLASARSLPRQLKDKRRVVGIRIPELKLLHVIVEKLGRPLATTSAPIIDFGLEKEQEPYIPLFGYQVFEAFGHALDMVVDLGKELTGQESTVIDLTDGVPEIVRLGAGDPKIFETL